ncbi:MAG: hypothetical protein DI547_12280 [Sphingobium sp.]|jgi:hypothetical protein|nr:MAG: hypothetical protein DI547_12280 [Sphingobium sp.]
MRKRALVLSTEHARHPFRRGLPAQVTTPIDTDPNGADRNDWKLFLLSFSAFFTVFYSFLS